MNTDLKKLEEKVTTNAKNIEDNSKKIQKNTGALEILHTINDCKRRYFTMWLFTFIAFLISIGYIIKILYNVVIYIYSILNINRLYYILTE